MSRVDDLNKRLDRFELQLHRQETKLGLILWSLDTRKIEKIKKKYYRLMGEPLVKKKDR